jgi:hypothetical protein
VREDGATVSRRDLLSRDDLARIRLQLRTQGANKLKAGPKGTSLLILDAGLGRYGGRAGVAQSVAPPFTPANVNETPTADRLARPAFF